MEQIDKKIVNALKQLESLKRNRQNFSEFSYDYYLGKIKNELTELFSALIRKELDRHSGLNGRLVCPNQLVKRGEI